MKRHAAIRCDGVYWFRLFPRYWDTTRLPDGRYDVEVRAWDVAGNLARRGCSHDRERRLAISDVGDETEPARRSGELQAPIALGGVAPRAVTFSSAPPGRARAALEEPAGLVLLARDDLVGVAPPDLERDSRARDLAAQCCGLRRW